MPAQTIEVFRKDVGQQFVPIDGIILPCESEEWDSSQPHSLGAHMRSLRAHGSGGFRWLALAVVTGMLTAIVVIALEARL
jgi:cytoskeletal protein RodZ